MSKTSTRPYVRKVLGRRLIEVNDEKYRFELLASGVSVRKFHGRKVRIIPFSDLIEVAMGQKLLQL